MEGKFREDYRLSVQQNFRNENEVRIKKGGQLVQFGRL